MIIWYNIKITETRLNPSSAGPRGNLKSTNRFDIAKYTFASFVPLEPIISKIIFNISLEYPYQGREQELEEWIRGLFPPSKIQILWHRCNNVAQWREIQPIIDAIDDDILYLAGNDDHVFTDANTILWQRGLELLSQDSDYKSALVYCHYPELMRYGYHRNAKLIDGGNFINFKFDASISIAVTQKELYHNFLKNNKNPDREVYRLDGFEWEEYYSNIYMATKEISRHYDGYTHVGMDPNVCPPLDIPVGFFEKQIIIRYGFPDRDPTCVNINPLSVNLYSTDIQGADYKFNLDDIPMFWRPYIKHIEIADDIDNEQLTIARNKHYLELSSATHLATHVPIPENWVNSHLK